MGFTLAHCIFRKDSTIHFVTERYFVTILKKKKSLNAELSGSCSRLSNERELQRTVNVALLKSSDARNTFLLNFDILLDYL